MYNICFVTSEIEEKNLALYEILSEIHKVIILCIGNDKHNDQGTFRNHYDKLNVEYRFLTDDMTNSPITPKNEFTLSSYSAFEYLKKNQFDFVLFGVKGGHGFFSIQAKKTSKYLNDTKIIILADKPSQWIKEETRSWNEHPVDDIKLWYAERYSVENADLMIIPTKEIHNWFKENNWKYTENYVINPIFQSIIEKSALDTEMNMQVENLFVERSINDDIEIKTRIENEKPLVSICIAHYNHHEYLPTALESILNTTYHNYEVIVVDDGSTLEEAHRVFDELTKKYNLPNWNFYKKQNEYLGQTRNYSVDKANGEYIIFVDADNAAKPQMIYDFLYGIYKSNADCLTCHISTFLGKQKPNEDTEISSILLPLGPILELGFTENVFGDANFIVKKKIYEELGGFATERLSLDDWEFLARLNLKGFKQDVIPDPIFWYRIVENSMVRTGDNYKSQHRIFKAYSKELPNYMRFMINGFIIPLYYKAEILGKKASSNIVINPNEILESLNRNQKIKLLLNIIFPKSSFRGQISRKLYRFIQKAKFWRNL
ncbi:glycosyltransferase family A protein [Paenibacillus sp. LjRoot153]|uniref:glycosyltransferase family 2 protein n=1 Tax=Paenibacillus sp. LjRoot153 TaxID=3342270 RepID=UPI003ECE46BA